MNLKPENNVTAGGVITSLTVMALETLSANGVKIPDSVMAGLPGIVGILVPYLWDLWESRKKPASDAQK